MKLQRTVQATIRPGDQSGYVAECAELRAVTLDVYRVTKQFPKDELYGLTSQTRRASASIAANIAEGCGRASAADFARFLQIAMGSASELEYHLILARDLQLLTTTDFDRLTTGTIETKRMLTALIQKVRQE